MKYLALAVLVGLTATGAGAVRAQQPAPPEPSITAQRAEAIALARVPNNEGVKSVKLKSKEGVLVYEVDVETPGRGHQEIRVDARTGAVLRDRHEDDIVGAATSKVTGAAHEAGHAVEHAAHETGQAVDRVLTGDEVRRAHPRISEGRARRIALHRFPTAKKVKDVDLERENGILVWEVDVDTPGEGHEEVLIDANTGRILSTHHEVGIAGKASQAVKRATH